MCKPFFVLFINALLLALTACSKHETIDYDLTPVIADQQQYFPLRIGHWTEYQVDSVVYDFAAIGVIRDSSTTFVREITTDTFRDNTGALTYKIERFERRNENDDWILTRIGSAGITGSQAIRTEDNLRYLSLIFPMDRRSEWNGLVWIDPTREIEIAGERIRPFSNWKYEVDSINIARQIGPFAFDSVLVITEADDSNIIEQRFSRSIYAKGVGLVWREQQILDSQYCNQNPVPLDCATKPWIDKAERGYLLRQTIIKYE